MNIADILSPHGETRPALMAGGDSLDYGGLRRRVAETAAGLAARGVRPGDRVVLMAGTEIAFVVGAFAVWAAGAVLVPVDPTSPPAEIERELELVEPVFTLAGGEALGPAGADTLASLLGTPVATPSGTSVPGTDELTTTGAVFAPIGRSDDDLAALMLTSGTSGRPRAVMLTHGNLAATQTQLLENPAGVTDENTVALGVLPLHHIFGLNVTLGTVLRAGGSLVLLPHFHAAESLEVIADGRITLVTGVPPMWAAWAAVEGAPPTAFDSVVTVSSGGAALPERTRLAVKERFGLDLPEGYGLTETSGIVSTGAGLPLRPGSVGRVVPGVEMRLVGESGQDVVVGDRGEIWVRGDNVTPGYWHDPAATVASLTEEGWLRTGDVGIADEEGYLYLVDRAKDMINVSGFNVFPAEVERVLMSFPGVGQAVVVGAEDDRSGERVVAHVCPRDGAELDPADLDRHCRSNLARYKCPSEFVLADELPVSPAGKRVRRSLRAD